eukprot:4225417-Alexandrium_andersonii.AAC.1
MSASLVGSEMCIRDSPLHALCRRTLGHHSHARRFGFAAVPDLFGFCALSVSYTHLTLPTICSV